MVFEIFIKALYPNKNTTLGLRIIMKPEINLISLITENFETMVNFYKEILSFPILNQMESYVEFKTKGVRFAITTTETMKQVTGLKEYMAKKNSHVFELAFDCDSVDNLDKEYKNLSSKGVKFISEPKTMPWNQRTAFFTDPDGNIHEIFANI